MSYHRHSSDFHCEDELPWDSILGFTTNPEIEGSDSNFLDLGGFLSLDVPTLPPPTIIDNLFGPTSSPSSVSSDCKVEKVVSTIKAPGGESGEETL
jgi:hypothetical protein